MSMHVAIFAWRTCCCWGCFTEVYEYIIRSFFFIIPFFCRYLLKVGDHNLSKKEKSEQLMDLEKIYVHANYIHTRYVNDIALVKLKAGVKLGKFVRTVCLPQKQEGDVAVPLNTAL